jgi:hypothetical protein
MIKLKNILGEAKEMGGYYLMKQLKDLAQDAKRAGERDVAKALMYLYDRINQSSRDEDLNADDLNDFLNEPRGRKHQRDLPDWMIDDLFEGINEDNLPSNIQKWIKDRGPKPSKDVKMIGKWVKKLTGREISGGVAIGKNYNTLVLDIEYEDAAIHYDTTSGDIKLYNKKIRNFNGFKKVFQANESVNERTDRFNNVHAESKKELKAGMSKAMDQIAKGKNPRFDIINGRTGEMIGWIEGQEYHWQPNAIQSALRELK